MKCQFLIGVFLAAMTVAAAASPAKLTEDLLDKITAGTIPVDPPPVDGHPWHPVPPPGFNPGGPISGPSPVYPPHIIVGCWGHICA
jgi:hypothetical protein